MAECVGLSAVHISIDVENLDLATLKKRLLDVISVLMDWIMVINQSLHNPFLEITPEGMRFGYYMVGRIGWIWMGFKEILF